MKIRKSSKLIIITILGATLAGAFSLQCYTENKLSIEVQHLLEQYLAKHAKDELVTAISLSISLPSEEKVQNYVAGKMSNKQDAPLLKKDDLFQIGSITKSFAAAIILQLEAEGKLNIDQTVGQWLPQYPKWKDVTIKSLLNMTSGIPGFLTDPEGAPVMFKKISDDLNKQWSNKEIVDFAYSLPHKTEGWDYSDTNYILIGMIVEKVTGHTFTSEIEKRLFSNKKLANMFYLDGPVSQAIRDKMPEGYYYGRNLQSTLYGKDTAYWNLSIAGPAGAIVATTEDVAHWVRLLFSVSLFPHERILPHQQLQELKELISITAGHPVKTLNSEDPLGFGLGVAEIYFPKGGTTWFYEGTTLGYRAYYLFTSCNNVIISLAMNSSPLIVEKGLSDNITFLARDIYEKILEERPEYKCR